jgi:hypothetical protein
MTPDIEPRIESYKRKYPEAQLSCKYIAYNTDYNNAYFKRCPINCTIDNQSRDCEGKCIYYKKSWLYLIFRK